MNGKKVLFVALLCLVFIPVNGLSGDIEETTEKKAAAVSKLGIGFGDYIIGKQLSDVQKASAAEHAIAKAHAGTYKFQDGDVYVVVDKKTDHILGVYKEKNQATRDEMKSMVGELMLLFQEPTAMAHDKMIYWVWDENGKVSSDAFDTSKDSGGLESLVTVKFSSSASIYREETGKEKENALADIYVIITSDPLSSLFLAQNR